MAQGSTATEQPVDYDFPKPYSELPTDPCHVELSLNFGTDGYRSRYRLSIEAPTFAAAHGILRVASAQLFDIALRDRSSGE